MSHTDRHTDNEEKVHRATNFFLSYKEESYGESQSTGEEQQTQSDIEDDHAVEVQVAEAGAAREHERRDSESEHDNIPTGEKQQVTSQDTTASRPAATQPFPGPTGEFISVCVPD